MKNPSDALKVNKTINFDKLPLFKSSKTRLDDISFIKYDSQFVNSEKLNRTFLCFIT